MSELNLFYMAPMQNAAPIAVLGILSYNELRRQPLEVKKLSVSIADPFVNYRRHRKKIDGRSLHDYVPLYWATHTPMQYVITQKSNVLSEDELVFFVLDPIRVLRIPGVMTTDGNAASQDTTVYEGLEALDHLNLKIIGTQKCYSREYRRKKCAEVLVPDKIPVSYIDFIAVRSKSAADTLSDTLQRGGVTIEVRVCPDYY